MHHFAASVIALLSLSLSELALAAQDFEILPVHKVSLANQLIQITFSVPCGNHFEGFLLKWDGQQSLKVGVVTVVGEVLCAGFPQLQTKDIKGINTSELLQVASIPDVDVRDRFKVITPGDIRSLKDLTPKGLSKIQMAYESRCGLFEGFVYRETAAGGVELAVAERISHEVDDKSCPFKQEITSLMGLKSNESSTVRTISFARVNLKKSYELALAPVLPGSIQSDSVKGLQLEYQRNCRQAPIGLVMSSPKGPVDRRVVVVGMVVAEFYNVECDLKAAPIKESFQEAALQLPSGFMPEVFASDTLEEFVLKQPSQYDTATAAKASFDYLQGCGKTFGAVYSRDKNGDLAVGILEASDEANCGKPMRENSLSQPYLTQTGLRSTVFPMKIRGAKL